MQKVLRLLKEPSVYFLLIGLVVFAVYNLSQSASDAQLETLIIIDKPTQEWIHGNFSKQFRRPPTRSEMDALIEAFIVSEVKYRNALDMGLDDRDSIIQRRMVQKFDFLFGNAAADSLPADSVLQEWYEHHTDEFLEPPTISFTHLYFSPDNRISASADAVAALKDIQERKDPNSDSFPFDVEFDEATPVEVRNVLGPEFARAVIEVPPGVWTGPIRSGLGFHLVRVSDVTPGKTPLFGEVRDAVLQRWREEESDRILQEFIAELTSQFEISIDEESLTDLEYSADSQADFE